MSTSLPIDDIHALLDRRASLLIDRYQTGGEFPDLRGCVRRLNGGMTLALDSDPQDFEPEIDKSAMTARFVISTASKDRMGDIVLPRGCLGSLKNFERNPGVFFSHRTGDLPIGSCRNADGSLGLEFSDDRIFGVCRFHGETPESEVIFRLVSRGELRAASIGFLPLEASVLNVEEDEDRPKKTADGERILYFDGFLPLRFLSWDLLEWSIVPVPANAEAIAMHLSRGMVEGEKISPLLHKALEPFALKARVWSHGFDPEKVKYTGSLKMGSSELEYKEGKLIRVGDHQLPQAPLPTAEFVEGVAGVNPAPKSLSIAEEVLPEKYLALVKDGYCFYERDGCLEWKLYDELVPEADSSDKELDEKILKLLEDHVAKSDKEHSQLLELCMKACSCLENAPAPKSLPTVESEVKSAPELPVKEVKDLEAVETLTKQLASVVSTQQGLARAIFQLTGNRAALAVATTSP